jgi:hypothetical protein
MVTPVRIDENVLMEAFYRLVDGNGYTLSVTRGSGATLKQPQSFKSDCAPGLV